MNGKVAKGRCAGKVAEFEVATLVEEKVAWFDVSVSKALGMYPCDGLDHVNAVAEDPVLVEETGGGAAWILGTAAAGSHEELAKVAAGNILHEHMDRVLSLKGGEELWREKLKRATVCGCI